MKWATRYETQTARLYDVTETLTAAFFCSAARFIAGDRKLTAARLSMCRARATSRM